MKSYSVYVVQNPRGQLYVGQTDNLERRLLSHNRTDKIIGKFTRKNGPWTLVWFEQYADRSTAVDREREIKSWKSSRLIRAHLLAQNE